MFHRGPVGAEIDVQERAAIGPKRQTTSIKGSLGFLGAPVGYSAWNCLGRLVICAGSCLDISSKLDWARQSHACGLLLWWFEVSGLFVLWGYWGKRISEVVRIICVDAESRHDMLSISIHKLSDV